MLRLRYFAALAIAAPLVAQTPERHTLRGTRVAIYDLVGDVRVVQGTGRDVEIEVTRQGADASQLRVETGDVGGVPTLRVIFPFDRIQYRTEYGSYGISDLRVRDDGTFGHGAGRRVTISSRSGSEAAADLVVRLPSGTTLDLKVAAGSVAAQGTHSDMSVEVTAADVALDGTRGNVVIETASGGVEAHDTEGNLDIDTGSGSVELTRVRATDLRVDVGSGSVDVALSRDAKNVYVDTGSGSVTLRVPESIGADVDFSTGSGDIDSDLPITIQGRGRGSLKGRIGDGTARITVSTGSGGIRIRKA